MSMDLSSAPKTTKFGQQGVTSRREISALEKPSLPCRQRKMITKNCALCGVEFSFRSSGEKNNNKRTFCTCSCAAKWRMSQPDRIEINREVGRRNGGSLKGKTNPGATRYMTENNPMFKEECRLKVSKTLREKKHRPVFRGGNGKPLTQPQKLLNEALGWENTEYVVKTASVQHLFTPRLPHHLKIDIANPALMIAIEVDGVSHKSVAGQERDRRKNLALSSLGWSVLRFTNQQVMSSLDSVIQEVKQLMTSK